MKKRNLLKNVLCLLLISSMALTLFSCGKNEPKETEKSTETEFLTENNTTRNTVIYIENETEATNKITYNYQDYDNIKDYDIIRVEDGYRLVFHDPLVYEEYGNYEGIIKYVHFESLQEFYDDLTNGTLSCDEKSIMYFTFPKDDKGIIIPDINNELFVLDFNFQAVFGDIECILDAIDWSQGIIYYHIYGINPDNVDDVDLHTYLGDIRFFTKSGYTKALKSAQNPYTVDYIETVDDKEVVEFINEKRQIRYTVSNEDKTIYIIENQRHFNDEIIREDTIAFFDYNGAYYSVTLADAIDNIEYLFEFNVEKYVPENG